MSGDDGEKKKDSVSPPSDRRQSTQRRRSSVAMIDPELEKTAALACKPRFIHPQNRKHNVKPGFWVPQGKKSYFFMQEEREVEAEHQRHFERMKEIQLTHRMKVCGGEKWQVQGFPTLGGAYNQELLSQVKKVTANSNLTTRLIFAKKIDGENNEMMERLYQAKSVMKSPREYAALEAQRQGYLKLHETVKVKHPRYLPKMSELLEKEQTWNDDTCHPIPFNPQLHSYKLQTEPKLALTDEIVLRKAHEKDFTAKLRKDPFLKGKKKKEGNKESEEEEEEVLACFLKPKPPPVYFTPRPVVFMDNKITVNDAVKCLPKSARRPKWEESDPEQLHRAQEEGERRRRGKVFEKQSHQRSTLERQKEEEGGEKTDNKPATTDNKPATTDNKPEVESRVEEEAAQKKEEEPQALATLEEQDTATE